MVQATVSIIIPNRDSKTIDKTLASLFTQTAFDQIEEILVVGVDEPGLVIERGPLRFISTQVPVTAPVARNIGIQQARGTNFVFIDADCLAEPEWLAALLAAQDADRQVVGGSVSIEGSNYWQLCYNLTMFHEFLPTAPPGQRLNLGTLNLFVSRRVVEHVGLLDESLARCQDTEWTLRMRQHGYTLYFDPNAVVKHHPQVTGLSQILKLWYRSGFFSGQVRQRYRKLIAPPPFYNTPLLLALLSPVIGTIVTTRIFFRNPRLFRYIHTIPVVFLTKIAWCMGTSQQSLNSP